MGHFEVIALSAVPSDVPLDDWNAFSKATKLKTALLTKIRPIITEKDPTAKAVKDEADPDLRDYENIPFTYEGGIEGFIKNEVLPYAPDAIIDEKSIETGYELSFTKYFYKPKQLRTIEEISRDIRGIEERTDGLLDEILGR